MLLLCGCMAKIHKKFYSFSLKMVLSLKAPLCALFNVKRV